MQLYTLQLSRYRHANERRIPYINTTVKNGVIAFAPTWDIVRDVKSGAISEEEYTRRYLALMGESQRRYPRAWDKLLSFDVVALSCYCKTGNFCHRLILADITEKLCQRHQIPFQYHGEI